MPEAKQNPSKPDLALSPHYHSAVNAITQPDRMVFVSGYLVERWLPELGGDGLAILVFLRKKCYYNRRTGEKRDKITVSLSDIARGCAISVNTVRRQMQNNIALRTFVSWREEYVVDGKRGGVIQTSNTYTVSMDDPIHPADIQRLEEELQLRETESKQIEDPKTRARQNAAQQRQDRQAAIEAMSATPSQNGRALPRPAPSQNGRALREEQRPPILGGESLDYFGLLQNKQMTQQQQASGDQENVVVALPVSLLEHLIKVGVTKVVAERLVKQYGEEAIKRQLDCLPHRKCLDPAATLVRAIQEEWQPPAAAQKSLPRPKVRVKPQEPRTAASGTTDEGLAAMRTALATARRKVRPGADTEETESE